MIFQGRGFQDGGNDPCSKYPINFQFSSENKNEKLTNPSAPWDGQVETATDRAGVGRSHATLGGEGRGGELSYGGYKALLGVIFYFLATNVKAMWFPACSDVLNDLDLH